MDWFKSERKKWATPIHDASLRDTPTLPGFDERSRELYGTALPRGVLLPRLEPDRNVKRALRTVECKALAAAG